MLSTGLEPETQTFGTTVVKDSALVAYTTHAIFRLHPHFNLLEKASQKIYRVITVILFLQGS